MSVRHGIGVLLVGLVFGLPGCGEPEEAAPTLEAVRAQAADLAARGAWALAAERYAAAFALVDPVPENAAVRALLALHRARALAEAGYCDPALEWFRVAERLDSTLYTAAYERARLHDGDCPQTLHPEAARREYEAFLAAWTARGGGEAEAQQVAHARARLGTLPVPREER